MPELPPGATEASRHRHALALELAEGCPRELGREIALTGSTSRGVADEDSDIEWVAWVDELPTRDERESWLAEAGAIDFAPATHTTQDGTEFHWCRYRDIWLEAGWQSITALERVLASLTAGDEIDHRRLTLADAIVHAAPLRTEGNLARWQGLLSHYPDGLQERLIQSAARRWTFTVAYWALARRSDRLAVAERLVVDIQSVLRIVLALNRTWEPAWKWTAIRTADLAIKPRDLTARIDAILSSSDLEQSVRSCAELFRDTLLMVPPDIDVALALANIEDSLRARTP
jgi:hypothetical protein